MSVDKNKVDGIFLIILSKEYVGFVGLDFRMAIMKLIQAFEITTPPPGKRSPPKEQENEAGSVFIVSVYKNKILYRPRTADPSTLTTDNLLTLANIITTSGLDHHCPPSLGVLTSVQVAMLYLQENIRQQALANIFGTSQPTISRAINNVLRHP